ncbi:MAG TPA: RNA polymerase sigma factor [Polyangiaceae bacterium]|nr:RNA polymerase sigma factor [Polyangiaceae bacterium]
MTPVVEQVLPWSSGAAYARSSDASADQRLDERAPLSFDSVYRQCFVDVARWVRALGANDADVEDLTQEVFIIVRRKLPGFDGRNLHGFLYRIAQRTVRDHRRSAWFRNLLGRRSPLPDLSSPAPSGLQLIQDKERRRVLEAILSRMSEKRRIAFVLFEIEGYSGEEIARIQSLPLKTVWTRLHHARKDFVRMVAELARVEGDE